MNPALIQKLAEDDRDRRDTEMYTQVREYQNVCPSARTYDNFSATDVATGAVKYWKWIVVGILGLIIIKILW